MTRSLTAALLLLVLVGWSWNAVADDDDDDGDGGFGRAPFTDLYVFGDSLSDSGNLFALTFGTVPPSPPYFDGRFSNGPVWVETLAPLLGLEVDFDTDVTVDPLANNQAVGGAFTDTRNENEAVLPSLAGTGILGQVASFDAAGGRIGRDDLVVIWGGANNYLFDPAARPRQVVRDLVEAVESLADLGARRFLLPNLPDLGRTPLGTMVLPADRAAFLSDQSRRHNRILARAAARLTDRDGLAVRVLDIEQALSVLLDASAVYANTAVPCIVQQPGVPPGPTGVCPDLGMGIDAGANGGALFWDLIHPTTNAHALIAFQAFGTVTGAGSGDRGWLAMR